jgi:hypothetical protein
MTVISTKTHNGKVVNVIGDKLTTMCSEGKQHCHTRAKDAKVTCAGAGARPKRHRQGGGGARSTPAARGATARW